MSLLLLFSASGPAAPPGVVTWGFVTAADAARYSTTAADAARYSSSVLDLVLYELVVNDRSQ